MRYELTHGVCEACEKIVETYVPEPSKIVARDLFAELTRAGRTFDLTRCEGFVQLALKAGLRSSEILIGLLHPALGNIGQQWERGEISVGDEHRFTAFASRVLQLVPFPDTPMTTGRPIVLVVTEGNQHDLGVQMLQRVARERGHSCVAIHPGVPDREVVHLAHELEPSMLGLSVSMATAIPAAVRLYEQLRNEGRGVCRVVLGGNAFRRPYPKLPEHVQVLSSIDDFLAAISQLEPQHRR